MTPRITLCADDFAHSRGTSEVIAGLAHGGRINAVTCMAVMPGWRDESALLVGVPRDCEIGLHLTLTDEIPLTRMPHFARGRTMPSSRALYRQAVLRKLPANEVANEVTRQFAAFSERMGRPPDFVDAHQHVHHFPQLREIILEVTACHAPAAWVRSCNDTVAAVMTRPFRGKAIGSAWHSLGYSQLARRFGLATNQSFAGHYDFSPRFASVFPSFFKLASDHHVIMTHPGAADRHGDSIARARAREANFLLDREVLAGVAQSWDS